MDKKNYQDQERQDQDQQRYDIIHNFVFKENEISQNSKTNSFDQNSISILLNGTELKNTPMSYAMVFPPQPFKTPLLDKYDSDLDKYDSDKEVFKITIYFFCHAQDIYRSARHFIKGNYLCCAEKLKSIFENFSDTIPMQSSLSLTSGQSSLLPYQGYDDPLNHILTPDKDLWKNNDLFIKENSFIENVLFPLVQSYYKINTLFLSYFQDNLHCIVETGLMPPLQNTDDESLQKWVLFQRNLFVSEKKIKIFTGKTVNISINGFPQGIQKTLQKTVFDTTVKSHASIRGISAAFITALRNAVAYVNSPLFFPMQFDWRGRLYYRTGFSPSQDAFTRSLINFSEPILIKAGSESEYFFFVALAKAIKKQDPASYQKYFDFVLDHQEDILESLTNFYWVTFDEPFIALNLIQNFNIYIKHNSQNQREKGVLLYVKVEWDASASIFQISSALMANADTARLCNLLPSSHLDSKLHPILDIYKHLLPTYQENVHSAEDGLEALLRNQIRKLKGKQKVDHKWTEKDICLNYSNILTDFLYNLDRKTIKRITMTKSYGKGTKGIQKDFIEHFIWLERLNNLKILKESNQDLNTNLLFIDFTKTPGLVKKRNWIKLKIDSKILKFKTFQKVYTVSKQIIIAFQGKADQGKPYEAQTKNNSFYNELLPLDIKNTTQIKKLFQDLASLQLKIDSLKTTSQQNLKNNLKKIKRDLVEKEISFLQEEYKHLQTSLTMEQLGLISEIESNSYWIHYVYQLIFYEISVVNSNNFVSFRDLRKVLKIIKKNLAIQKRKPSFLILRQKSAGIETIQQTDLTPTCFHTRDEGTIALRKEIFDSLTHILIDSVFNLQYMQFRQILAENVTKITERCVLKSYQDHFRLSNFLSMLTYFCASRDFPFLANCFEDLYYTSHYKQIFTTDFTYSSDLLSKNKLEKKRKKVLKYGIQGTESDPDKGSIAAPANFVQAFDSEILRKVVPAFLNHNENRQLWVRHDCFVITPNLVTTLEQSYKKSFVDTFFKNSQDFLFSEFGVEIQFELARNSPIYIFQILIISNFCNILDYSLHLQGRASANLSEEKKEKRNHHVKIKKLLLDFLKNPSLENITDILFSIESTILASNNDNGDGASKTKRLEETLIKKKKKNVFTLQEKEEKGIIILDDLERRIDFEKKQNQLEIVELKKQLDAVKNSGQSKKVLNKNVLKAKKALDRKEKFKSKILSKLTKQLDQQDKIKNEKNKLLLELNQSFSSSDFNVEQMKKLALKELAIEESKLKNLKNINSYKQSNHVQPILLFYRIIENKISQSSFNYYEILGESHPLS